MSVKKYLSESGAFEVRRDFNHVCSDTCNENEMTSRITTPIDYNFQQFKKLQELNLLELNPGTKPMFSARILFPVKLILSADVSCGQTSREFASTTSENDH